MKSRSISRGGRLSGLAVLASVVLLVASCSQPAKPLPQIVTAAPPPVAAPVPAPTPDQDLVTDERAIAAAQRALTQLGYNAGKPDGVTGPATRRAILVFQKDHALAEDGRLTFTLANMLNTLLAQLPKVNATTVAAGDTVIFGDGSVEIARGERAVTWEQDGSRGIVAIRPSTAGWPPAARAGLEWATTHALDVGGSGPPVQWASTGVDQHFEIYISTTLSPRETALAGNAAQSCHHFELRADGPQKRYPGIACRDAKGDWYLPHTRIRLAHPATGLGAQTASDSAAGAGRR
jgi:peptidoglycan hydrolase-like protein with peptidoglycan-binding domain